MTLLLGHAELKQKKEDTISKTAALSNFFL
jgi:hypothetical protein